MQSTFVPYIEIIRRRFPGIGVDEIKIFADGFDHDVFVVRGEFTFRFLKGGRGIDPKRATFLRKFAQRSPVAFPQIEIYQDEATGVQYELNSFLPGVPFDPSVAATFGKDALLRVAQEMGGFLTALHSFPLDEARSLNVDEMDPSLFWEYMEQHPNAYPHYREVVFPHLTEQEQKWVQRLFEEYIAQIRVTPFPVHVTHNDLWTYHIIVDPAKRILSGVIDFGLRIADPAHDFKPFEHYGRAFVDELYRHYQASVDEHFEQRRLFYTGHDMVYEFARALESGDRQDIAVRKEALSEYISAHMFM